MSHQVLKLQVDPGIAFDLLEAMRDRLAWPACRCYRHRYRNLLKSQDLFEGDCRGGVLCLSPSRRLWKFAGLLGLHPEDFTETK